MVVLNGSGSAWMDVTSGVPQGSVLGPLLFVIFINDIETVLDQTDLFLSKFADDTKAGRVVDTQEGADKLQKDLDNFSKWARDWQMMFNVGKCKVLHLGNSNPRHKYFMDGKELMEVDEEKDLGVMIHQSLKPAVQVAAAAKFSARLCAPSLIGTSITLSNFTLAGSVVISSMPCRRGIRGWRKTLKCWNLFKEEPLNRCVG